MNGLLLLLRSDLRSIVLSICLHTTRMINVVHLRFVLTQYLKRTDRTIDERSKITYKSLVLIAAHNFISSVSEFSIMVKFQ